MNEFNILILAIAVLSVAFAVFTTMRSRINEKRVLDHLDAMLTAAMDGTFDETIFDESLLSSVETKFAHYLSASSVSARNLAEEKKKIKELIADISHQTKTPLSNILLYAQLLGEQDLPQESLPFVTALNTQAEKLSFLIGSLVKTSRLETGVIELHPKQSAVQPMLDTVLAQVAPKAGEKQLLLACNATAADACFDTKWTAEAIYNILDNAVKYTPCGGTIQIATTVYSLFCRIDIKDTGIGIPEEEQAKVFARFYRSPAVNESEGVGIGLYLARQIIADEGGYIKVNSKVGGGTCFSVFLPIAR